MKPRSIGSEQHILQPGPAYGLGHQVEAADTGRIGIAIRMACQQVDNRSLGTPVVGGAPEVGYHEGHVGYSAATSSTGNASPITS
jgi:hypothetical protein